MAMNIEQRLEQSATSIEQSSQKAHDFAEKDTTLQTCAGSRDSLPKVSRIWQENFARQFNKHATEFQDRFAISQQSLPWQAGITISDSLQRYHVGVQGEEGYKEFLPNPLKLPFETAATLADDLTQDRWLENGVPNKHWTESKVASALEKSLGANARIWPKDRDLQVGDVIPAPEDTADGLPITHLIVDGNAYAMIPIASGLVSDLSDTSATIGGAVISLEPVSGYYGKECSFIFEGDSITEGTVIGGYKYSDVFAQLSFAKGRGSVYNFAVGGSFIVSGTPNINDRYATSVRPLRPASKGGSGQETVYLFIMIGTNDLDIRYGNKTDEQVIQAITAYCQTAMTDGFTVVLQTILPRKNNNSFNNDQGWTVTQEKYRVAINAAIRRGTIPRDIVADTECFVNEVQDTAVFTDGVHPSVAATDAIALYLNSLMRSEGSSSLANVLTGRELSGVFETKNKTVLSVGSEFARTSLGTDKNDNRNGFLVLENLNPAAPDSGLWFFETGVDGNKVKVLPINDDGTLAGKPAMTFNRFGMRAWSEFGNVGQKVFLGMPGTDNDFGKIIILNLNSNLTPGVPDKGWGIECSDGTENPTSLKITCTEDDGSAPVAAVELLRIGKKMSAMKLSGGLITESSVVGPAKWAFGQRRNDGVNLVINSTDYIQVEIDGQLVNIPVLNDIL